MFKTLYAGDIVRLRKNIKVGKSYKYGEKSYEHICIEPYMLFEGSLTITAVSPDRHVAAIEVESGMLGYYYPCTALTIVKRAKRLKSKT